MRKYLLYCGLISIHPHSKRSLLEGLMDGGLDTGCFCREDCVLNAFGKRHWRGGVSAHSWRCEIAGGVVFEIIWASDGWFVHSLLFSVTIGLDDLSGLFQPQWFTWIGTWDAREEEEVKQKWLQATIAPFWALSSQICHRNTGDTFFLKIHGFFFPFHELRAMS